MRLQRARRLTTQEKVEQNRHIIAARRLREGVFVRIGTDPKIREIEAITAEGQIRLKGSKDVIPPTDVYLVQFIAPT